MDTSEFVTYWDLKGTSSIVENKKVKGETWVRLLLDIYRSQAVHQIPGLFVRIGEMMDGKHYMMGGPIPHGKTRFEKGIGVNTLARASLIKEENYGEQLVPDSPQLTQYRDVKLLLLLRQEDKPVTWAHWTVRSDLAVRGDAGKRVTKRTIVESMVRYADQEEVQGILEREAHCAVHLLDIGDVMDIHARKLLESAYQIGKFSGWVRDVYDRARPR